MIKAEHELLNSEESFDSDESDSMSDMELPTSNTHRTTGRAMIKALAQVLAKAVVEGKANMIETPLSATEPGENEAIDIVVPEAATKLPNTLPFRQAVNDLDREPFLNQIKEKCAMPERPRLRRDDYTVGWICALPIELAAAQEMLDEEHEYPEPDENDNNVYSFGRIGGHNVVMACLPAGQYGTSSAGPVAMQMVSSFHNIRIGLMVGIGGGVPSAKADIRLGDVVVSQPGEGHGGVIQFDFGKSTPGGFKRTGSLDAPPRILLDAVANLRANHERSKGNPLPHISRPCVSRKFCRDHGDDMLFEGSYNHAGGGTCSSCDSVRMIPRNERTERPVIHYGTIASGNQIVRDGVTRDRISSEFGRVLCFEMEAAGLENFPCLVVRGICDYADSHRSKKWQPYAAGTAAAYVKDLLSVISRDEVTMVSSLDETIKAASGSFNTWYNRNSNIGYQVGAKYVWGNRNITI